MKSVAELYELAETRGDTLPCTKADPVEEVFFDEEAPTTEIRSLAERYCSGCPLASHCLDGALEDPNAVGLYGGHWVANGEIWPWHKHAEQLRARSRRRQSIEARELTLELTLGVA